MTNLKEEIIAKAKHCGYSECEVLSIEELSGYNEEIKKRQTLFPDAYHAFQRVQGMTQIPAECSWAKSVIVAVIPYGKYKIPTGWDKYIAKSYLCDYRNNPDSAENKTHSDFEEWLTAKNIRYADDQHVRIPARWMAIKAGLGSIGRNNFFYDKQHGSWVIIETWLIDKAVEESPVAAAVIPYDTCPPDCNRCLSACPTQALAEPFRTNPVRCVTRQTYGLEHNGLAPESIRSQLGYSIYGCDICQNVCPRNQGKWQSDKNLSPNNTDAMRENPNLLDMLTYGKELLSERFCTMLRGREEVLLCNIIRAMVNEAEKSATNSSAANIAPELLHEYQSYIETALLSEHENVREMAAWAQKKLLNL